MVNKKSWLKDDTFSLIEMFEQLPELWNVKSKEYRDRNKKEKALAILVTKLFFL